MKYIPYLILFVFILVIPQVVLTALFISAYEAHSWATMSGALSFAITFSAATLGVLLFLFINKSLSIRKRLVLAFIPLLAIPVSFLIAVGFRAHQQRTDGFVNASPLDQASHILSVDGKSFTGIKFWIGVDDPHEIVAGYRPSLTSHIGSEPSLYPFGPLRYELPETNIHMSTICIPVMSGFVDCFVVGIVDAMVVDARNTFLCMHTDPIPGKNWIPESACGIPNDQGFFYIWDPSIESWPVITGVSMQWSDVESDFSEPVHEFDAPFPISWAWSP